MLNHIVVMGRLTRDPELRKTASGVSVASFSVAVDRDFSQQDGKKETDFLDVVAWRNTAEFAAKYFTKGRIKSDREYMALPSDIKQMISSVAQQFALGDGNENGG